MQPDDRAYLVRLVVAQTGSAAPDAERRVDDVAARAKDAIARARRSAGHCRFCGRGGGSARSCRIMVCCRGRWARARRRGHASRPLGLAQTGWARRRRTKGATVDDRKAIGLLMPEWIATGILAFLLGLAGIFAARYTIVTFGVILCEWRTSDAPIHLKSGEFLRLFKRL
jgi:hypothetical protein